MAENNVHLNNHHYVNNDNQKIISESPPSSSTNSNKNNLDKNNDSVCVLLSVNMQQDYIGPMKEATDPLPNPVHVGFQEASRVLGQEPNSGPFMHLLNWARSQQKNEVFVIHVCDWHDSSDPKQKEHLERFESHCLANSLGAQLVLDQDKIVSERSNEFHINCPYLNPFEGTQLFELIHSIQRKVGSQKKLRIGVIGVWTEAMITFLLYDLTTRFNFDQVATCSALTASRSRLQHFNALQNIQRILGTAVLDSVGEFADFLLPHGKPIASEHLQRSMCSKIRFDTNGTPSPFHDLSSEDKGIVCSEVILKTMADGNSNAFVFQVISLDPMGHRQAPSVLKIGPRKSVARERVNFERVEDILGNNAPSVRGFVDLGQRAGIKFAYAAMVPGGVLSFKRFFMHPDDLLPAQQRDSLEAQQQCINRVLNEVFNEVLGKFYIASSYERIKLLDSYDFDGTGWAYFAGGSDTPHHVRERVSELLQDIPTDGWPYYERERCCPVYDESDTDTDSDTDTEEDHTLRVTAAKIRSTHLLHEDEHSSPDNPDVPSTGYNSPTPDTLTFPGGAQAPSVADFLEYDLPKIPRFTSESHFVSFVHGDLHGGNIMLDSKQNVWLIDFYYTGRAHVLKDVTKLEADILFEYTPLENWEELIQAMLIVDRLACISNLALPLPESLDKISYPHLQKQYSAIKTLHTIITHLVKRDSHPNQFFIAMLRYSLFAMCLPAPSRKQKILALYAACKFAHRISENMKRNREIFVSWMPTSSSLLSPTPSSEQLSMFFDSSASKHQHHSIPSKMRGMLGITIMPGRKDRGRVLHKDLKKLKVVEHVSRAVCLSTHSEMFHVGLSLAQLNEAFEEYDIPLLFVPIRDQGVPTHNQMDEIQEWVHPSVMKPGERIVVFDIPGLGRAGTIVASLLVKYAGLDAAQAMQTVKEYREVRAIENKKQQSFVKERGEIYKLDNQ